MDLKTAIELVKKSHPYATKYKGVEEDEALQVLVDLATHYLAVSEGMPKKIDEDNMSINPNYRDGYNLAIDDCTAHFARMVDEEKIEKIIDEKLQNYILTIDGGEVEGDESHTYKGTPAKLIKDLTHSLVEGILKKEEE